MNRENEFLTYTYCTVASYENLPIFKSISTRYQPLKKVREEGPYPPTATYIVLLFFVWYCVYVCIKPDFRFFVSFTPKNIILSENIWKMY